MNRNQNDRSRNLEKPIQGCLGGMVNLFDLNTNVGRNRLLTENRHHEGSMMSRSQSDVSRTSLVGDQMNDKVRVSELRKSPSNRKTNGTPIKMLIAQEMSKEEGPKQSPPNLVAKLMGLDTLPQGHQLGSASCRKNLRGSRCHSGPLDSIQREHGFMDIREHIEINREYKDIFEIWQQSFKTYVDSPRKGRYKESKNEKSMALVREKFMEAKRLSTDEKLRQSKQFQDALEVLSSNKDLFLKFLQEPNSLFSQHHSLQSVLPPPDSRRITILKPSKLVDGHKLTGSGKKTGKQINGTVQMDPCNIPECCKFTGNPTQPTRIVILKPSFGKPHDIKVVPSPPPSLRTSNDDGFYGDLEDSEVQESTEVPKETTRGMSESPSGGRRNEALLSSVFSNGYIGDESSFSKSEVYYAAGNLSDSEVMSPTSRHSWDYINRFGSPYSSSSFSRASYSPESSVCREAKKRLSERWTMMALNGSGQEQRHVRRSSSTLGEMLALSDLKKSVESDEHCENREGSKGSTSSSTSDLNKVLDADRSPKNLLVCPTASGSSLGEVSELVNEKKDYNKDSTKEKSLKSSLFKGKVSSLFFSKSRKSSKQKSHKPEDEHQSGGFPVDSPRDNDNDGSQCINDKIVEGIFSITKPETSVNPNENQDQPSPISVLELQFEDDDHATGFSRNAKLTEHGINRIKCTLIDKSPSIGSIARTLSWDESALGPVTAPWSPEEERDECLFYVQTLLSAAGIGSEGEVQSYSFLTKWHSPESPLDPSLKDKYMTLTDKEPPLVHYSKQRRQRSIQNLIFDCVNEVLTDITHKEMGMPSSMVADHVWACMKEWICGEHRCGSDGNGEDGGTVAVERVARNEVVRQAWVEHLRLEIDDIKKEIEDKLVEELVLELTGSE